MRTGFAIAVACLLFRVGLAQEIFSKTDTQAEIELGREAYEGFLRNAKVSQNESYRRRVQRVLDQLQSVLPYRQYPFQAVILVENSVNATCYPGGYMFVHEGLLVKMSEDNQLAFTLAHEIGHAVRRHWARFWRVVQTDTIVDILARVLSKGQYTGSNPSLRYLSYKRDQESEADAFGTELYLRAGFPPDHVGDGMKVLVGVDQERGGNRRDYLSDHPDSEKRLADILALSERLLANGLKPATASDPIDVSIRSVFGDLPSISATGTDLIPFVPGTEWVYSVQSQSGATTYSTRVTGCAEVLTSRVARFETKVGEKSVSFQVMAEPNRLYRRNRPDKPDSKWTLEAMIPEYGGTEESECVRYRHAGVEEVATPAGVFPNCVKIETKNAEGRVVEVWYAPGVGMVKRFNASSQVTEILISFHKG